MDVGQPSRRANRIIATSAELAAVVAAHEIADVFVIANGVRAGESTRPPSITHAVNDHLTSAREQSPAILPEVTLALAE